MDGLLGNASAVVDDRQHHVIAGRAILLLTIRLQRQELSDNENLAAVRHRFGCIHHDIDDRFDQVNARSPYGRQLLGQLDEDVDSRVIAFQIVVLRAGHALLDDRVDVDHFLELDAATGQRQQVLDNGCRPKPAILTFISGSYILLSLPVSMSIKSG